MNQRRKLRISTISFLLALAAYGSAQAPSESFPLTFQNQQIAGPKTPAEFPAWLEAMKAWRTKQLAAMKYDGSNYGRPALQWTRSSFMQPLAMVEDRYFYDPVTRAYTVDRYLADVKKRYGGIDSVLIWPTYPNIGIDDRNTDDMLRSMPGGVPGVRRMIRDFQKAGVKVLLPIHPWDIGTREPVKSWSEVLPATMAEIGADGLNGDTMDAVTQDYFDNAVAKKRPLGLEPEIGLSNQINQLGWNLMSWGYWDYSSNIPTVSKNKWLEPRHLVHLCDRWATDKNRIIQYAFFNGVGVTTWENVWGIWNPITERDAEAIRRIATIERAFPDLLASPNWTPFAPTLHGDSVFASMWPSADGTSTLWTLINTSESPVNGKQIEVPYVPGTKYYDLWSGRPLDPAVSGNTASLSFDIEPNGYGAVLAVRNGGVPKTAIPKPLSSFANTVTFLRQTMTPIAPTKPAAATPPGMVMIPAGEFDFKVKGIEIEGDDMIGIDVQYPWESEPRRAHEHKLSISSFFIDRYPVTNAQFKRFMSATHYKPADSQNFLKDWKRGAYPQGWDFKPVTWVSLEDARAYAAWAGKRLPHEWEWQYAAQGTDGRLYPWGDKWADDKAPAPDKGRALTPPSDVTASTGQSPFGVADLVGNVWQWTDEYTDEHTRAAILKGGSHYQPQGSMWYFPQAYKLDQHGKYLLMAPARDRSGTIGFRCVVDR